tara:strand:- start:33926 stop:34111 length:186 start_codon:yes stop_codon:yes gene_type:complete
MSTPKVHLVFESPWRFGDEPAQWVTRCSAIQSENINPETTTRDADKVTCKNCQRLAKARRS